VSVYNEDERSIMFMYRHNQVNNNVSVYYKDEHVLCLCTDKTKSIIKCLKTAANILHIKLDLKKSLLSVYEGHCNLTTDTLRNAERISFSLYFLS